MALDQDVWSAAAAQRVTRGARRRETFSPLRFPWAVRAGGRFKNDAADRYSTFGFRIAGTE